MNRVTNSKYILFVCEKGHDYSTRVERKIDGAGCHYCLGYKFKSGINDVLSLMPLIEKHFSRKEDLELLANSKPSSKQKVYFTWKCEHSWFLTIQNAVRIFKKDNIGCPFCLNRELLVGFNDLKSSHPYLEKGFSAKNEISFEELFTKERRKVEWICSLGHTFYLSPRSRTMEKFDCYYCSGRKCWAGFNDITVTHPEFLDIWDFSNNTLKPTEVMSGMKRLLWWVCEYCNESYQSMMYNIKAGKRHSKCSGRISKSEIELYSMLSKSLGGNYTIKQNEWSVLKKYELDIYLPREKVAIEFNGEYWHSEEKEPFIKRKHDEKELLCAEKSVFLIVVWELEWARDNEKTVNDILTMIKTREIIEEYTYQHRRNNGDYEHILQELHKLIGEKSRKLRR